VVSFAKPAVLRNYQKHQKWKFDLYADPEKKLYKAFGLRRAKLREVLHPSAMKKYMKYLFQGKKMEMPTDDIYQMGGNYILSAEGKLVYAHQSQTPVDRPSVPELLRELSKA